MAESSGNTGTRDVTYNVISIIYHALQGAETYDQYIRDAEQSGDRELAEFFRGVRDRNRETADQGKRVLSSRLNR